MQYVDGDYQDPATVEQLRKALGGATRPAYVHSVQITMAEDFGIAGRGRFYDETGAIRDVVQNHLLHVVALLVMELPTTMHAESLRDEQVKVFRQMPAIDPANVVREQFRGYHDEPGVAPGSAALA